MEHLTLTLWVLVPCAVQLVLLSQTRRSRRPLRFVLLAPLGALLPLAVLGFNLVLLADLVFSEGDPLSALLGLLSLLAVFLFVPPILLRAGLFLLGWGLAWGIFALWSEIRRECETNSCKIPPGSL